MVADDIGDAMLQGLRELPGGISRTYLAPSVKVMFESINKNACTSLKWMMAELAGEDLSLFRAELRPFTSDSEAVHDRKLWTASPKLDAMSPEERQGIHPDNGWFIFAVVRDPRLRLFSAWQNKLLIESPHSERWREESWYPRHPLTRETVVEDFARFVHVLEDDRAMWLRCNDPHFRDQVELLAEPTIPYTRIYEIHELKKLEQDLEEHVLAQGRTRKLYIPRANSTPLRAVPELFRNGTREIIERVYAADFERFGDMWDFSLIEAAEPWTNSELLASENEAMLGRRITELRRLATEERKKNRGAQRRIKELREKAANLEGELASSISEPEARRPWWALGRAR